MKDHILFKLQKCLLEKEQLINNYENNYHYDKNYDDYLMDRITILEGKIQAYEELLKK